MTTSFETLVVLIAPKGQELVFTCIFCYYIIWNLKAYNKQTKKRIHHSIFQSQLFFSTGLSLVNLYLSKNKH